MIKSRNESSNSYNEETANDIEKAIICKYFGLFLEFKEKMTNLELTN